MSDFPVLRDLGFVVVGAATLLFATRALRLPPILAYILAGLGLGPGLGRLSVSPSLETFSELGVALLLFLVGLELSLDRIRDVGRPAVIGGLLQVAVTTLLGAALGRALGFPGHEALFLGLVAAFSSTVVVVKLLDEAGELSSVHGRIAIGVLLVQDVLVAVTLTLAGGLGGDVGRSLPALAASLGSALLGIALLVAVAAAAARWGLSRAFRSLSGAPEALFVASLAWCFGFILAAEALRLSIELGAFVAGVALAQAPESRELGRRVHPLVELFLAVFFVSLGAALDTGAVLRQGLAVAALSAFVLLAKPAITGGLLLRLGRSRETAFRVGLTLGQVSEFSFILAGLAVAGGWVRPELMSLVGIVGLVTIAGSALLAPRADALVRGARTRGLIPGPTGPEGEDGALAGPAGHVIVVGMNALGRRIARALDERNEAVLAVDTDPAKLKGLPCPTLVGDVSRPSVLEELGLARARLLVSALHIEDVNALLAHRCAALDVPCSLHALDPSVADELTEIGADHLMLSKLEVVRHVARAFRVAGVEF